MYQLTNSKNQISIQNNFQNLHAELKPANIFSSEALKILSRFLIKYSCNHYKHVRSNQKNIIPLKLDVSLYRALRF